MDNWQPIESAPTDGTYVDLWIETYAGGSRYPDMQYRAGDHTQPNDWYDRFDMWSVVGDGRMRLEQITHWMPRPKGPNGEQDIL